MLFIWWNQLLVVYLLCNKERDIMKTTTVNLIETNYPKIIVNTAFVVTLVMMIANFTSYVNYHWGYSFVPVVGSLVGVWLYCWYLVNIKK